MTMFAGKTALRTQYAELTASQVDAATDQASALFLLKMNNWGRLAYIENNVATTLAAGVELTFWVVHPEEDPTVLNNRLLWFNLSSPQTINFSVGNAPGISFDPGTRIYVSKTNAVTSTAGKVKIAVW